MPEEPSATLGFAIIHVFLMVCAIVSAMIAERKGRSGVAWALLGYFLAPLAILIVAFLPARPDAAPSGAVRR